MKKYNLKKDFPSSKIGDVWVKEDNGFMSPVGRETIKMHESLFKPFNEWFEDYEEQCWYITLTGEVREGVLDADWRDERRIGNYFKTKEEAEKAVERLKALKRLKDKGFRFDGYDVANRGGDDVICGQVYFKAGNYDREEIEDDLFLLFGGEE